MYATMTRISRKLKDIPNRKSRQISTISEGELCAVVVFVLLGYTAAVDVVRL